jgi:hypothetical protein
MIVMISNHDLDAAEEELGLPCEQIFTPESRHQPYRPKGRFCMDNGAFSNWNETSFTSLLERELPRLSLCRFVCVPDVVGSARRTLEVFDLWECKLSGWPLAFVCQDGQEDLPIPWGQIDALFIGGTSDWKLGPHARHCIATAKLMGKWCHVGRVNTPGRFEYFNGLGADSIDGSGLSRYSHMREAVYRSHQAPTLKL